MDLLIIQDRPLGPNGPDLRFGLVAKGPGYCIGHTVPMGLASGMISPFF